MGKTPSKSPPTPPSSPAAPAHLAFIPDGNRRWAKRRRLSPIEGHQKGIDKMGDVLKWCRDLGVKTVSFWAFSTENFERDRQEVEGLFKEFEQRLQRVFKEAEFDKYGVRVRFIGDIGRFPPRIQQGMRHIEEQTRRYDQYRLNLFIGYGGRPELVAAARRLARQYRDNPDQIDEAAFARALWTSELPDPDLIIRTSGEQRISGFMPFQSAYAELYFCPKLWPDLTRADIKNALAEYSRRQRRWGK